MTSAALLLAVPCASSPRRGGGGERSCGGSYSEMQSRCAPSGEGEGGGIGPLGSLQWLREVCGTSQWYHYPAGGEGASHSRI